MQWAVMTTVPSHRRCLLGLFAVLVATTLPTAAAVASVPATTIGPRGSLAAGPFDGRWHTTLSRAQLIRAGAEPASANALYGSYSARFALGRFTFSNGRTHRGARGSFVVRGKVARFTFSSGVGLRPGEAAELRWSVYRDRLTFKAIRGRPALLLDAGIWTRDA
jgi:hypothetical protein